MGVATRELGGAGDYSSYVHTRGWRVQAVRTQFSDHVVSGKSASHVTSRGQLVSGRQRYVGAIQYLRGKIAFVRPRVGTPGQVMVRFEEPFLEEARDWWQFAATDFDGDAHSDGLPGHAT